eukprot:scaffold6852_cov215-Ochromonas_danica.AAC.23
MQKNTLPTRKVPRLPHAIRLPPRNHSTSARLVMIASWPSWNSFHKIPDPGLITGRTSSYEGHSQSLAREIHSVQGGSII